jgi:hypothetical protein
MHPVGGSAVPDSSGQETDSMDVTCPSCSTVIELAPPANQWIGKIVRCPSCENPFTFTSASKICPECENTMVDGVICVSCGLDLRTGKKVNIAGKTSQDQQQVNNTPDNDHAKHVAGKTVVYCAYCGVELYAGVSVCPNCHRNQATGEEDNTRFLPAAVQRHGGRLSHHDAGPLEPQKRTIPHSSIWLSVGMVVLGFISLVTIGNTEGSLPHIDFANPTEALHTLPAQANILIGAFILLFTILATFWLWLAAKMVKVPSTLAQALLATISNAVLLLITMGIAAFFAICAKSLMPFAFGAIFWLFGATCITAGLYATELLHAFIIMLIASALPTLFGAILAVMANR